MIVVMTMEELYIEVDKPVAGEIPLSTRALVELLKLGKAWIPYQRELKVKHIEGPVIELEVVRAKSETIEKAGGWVIEQYDRMERRKGIYLVKWSKAKTVFQGTDFEKIDVPLEPILEEREEWKANVEEMGFDEMLMRYW